MKPDDASGYRYDSADLSHAHDYLLVSLFELLDGVAPSADEPRLFELGCGNGSVANALATRGWDVTGVDPSTDRIEQARAAYPNLKLDIGSAYDDLAARWPSR